MPRSVALPVEIYEIKITLRDSRPPIWRRIQVRSDTTHAKLHRILQRWPERVLVSDPIIRPAGFVSKGGAISHHSYVRATPKTAFPYGEAQLCWGEF
jgi:hypothetical protein